MPPSSSASARADDAVRDLVGFRQRRVVALARDGEIGAAVDLENRAAGARERSRTRRRASGVVRLKSVMSRLVS